MTEAHKRPNRHPKYKTAYHVINWPEYDKALRDRGDITLWISQDAIDAWTPPQTGKRGAQPLYSDLAIETALSLRLLFHLALRQTIVSPRKDAVLSPESGTNPSQRDQHLLEIERVGRFQWKRTSGYYDQSRAENAFSRFKKTFGGRLRAKRDESQEREASLACQLLNRMLELGRPQSYLVG